MSSSNIGYFCLGADAADEDPVACPKGTYGPREGLIAQSECEDCPAGMEKMLKIPVIYLWPGLLFSKNRASAGKVVE